MQSVDLQEDIDRVADCGPLKVWSVVITILGDLLQDEDKRLSGPLLDALVGRMGINNQALRVALHRLRREGWIESSKQGRMSDHKLTAVGWAQTEAVRPQVYGREPDPSQHVSLVIGAPQLSGAAFAALLPDAAVVLSPKAALVVGLSGALADCLVSRFAVSDLPEWVLEALASKVVRAEYDELAVAVVQVLAHPIPEDPLDRAALRLVIFHQWRRLRLRHGAVQDAVLPADWEGGRARRLVMRALTQLERPEVPALERLLRVR